ncbi:MAG: hypothetical protein JSV00_09610, partial [bacterium]
MKYDLSRFLALRRKVTATLVPCLLMGTVAFADSPAASGPGGISVLTWLFFGFVGLIVLAQLVPALVIFGSLLKAVFSRAEKAVEAADLT